MDAKAGTPSPSRMASSATQTINSVKVKPRGRWCIPGTPGLAGIQVRPKRSRAASVPVSPDRRKLPRPDSGSGYTCQSPRREAVAVSDRFQLVAPYQPAGDQPQAIRRLIDGFEAGLAQQTLLGVTGSGKTYTMANVIEAVQKPTLVLAPNKTLAAQLYGEFKSFFPHNSVEYFVSYYDY